MWAICGDIARPIVLDFLNDAIEHPVCNDGGSRHGKARLPRTIREFPEKDGLTAPALTEHDRRAVPAAGTRRKALVKSLQNS